MGGESDSFDELLMQIASAPDATLAAQFGGGERFALVRQLGEGSFGVGYEARDRVRSAC